MVIYSSHFYKLGSVTFVLALVLEPNEPVSCGCYWWHKGQFSVGWRGPSVLSNDNAPGVFAWVFTVFACKCLYIDFCCRGILAGYKTDLHILPYRSFKFTTKLNGNLRIFHAFPVSQVIHYWYPSPQWPRTVHQPARSPLGTMYPVSFGWG